MDYIIHLLTDFGLSYFEATAFVKMILASTCGALIGLEREMKGRPAGLKTFSLVCLGATLVMITNDYIYTYITEGTGDITRMAAQVISGIGFLGAGAIIVTGHNQIRGLTTAASLWVTASLGITIGSGFYFGAIAGFCVIYVSAFLYQHVDEKILEYSRIMRIYVEGIDEDFMLRLIDYLNDRHAKVISLKRRSESKWYASDACADIELDFGKRVSHQEVMNEIKALEGLRYIEEI